jgi:glutaredoxin
MEKKRRFGKDSLSFKRIARILINIVVFAAVLAVFILLIKNYNANPSPDYAQKLAVCMSQKGITFYGRLTCPYCQAQIKIFGNAFKSINFVNCDVESSLCSGLEGVPAWKINGQMNYGVKTLEELSNLSNCELK